MSSVRPAKNAGCELASVFEKIKHVQSFQKRWLAFLTLASFFCWLGARQVTSVCSAHFAAGQRAAMSSRWACEFYWSRVNPQLRLAHFASSTVPVERWPARWPARRQGETSKAGGSLASSIPDSPETSKAGQCTASLLVSQRAASAKPVKI